MQLKDTVILTGLGVRGMGALLAGCLAPGDPMGRSRMKNYFSKTSVQIPLLLRAENSSNAEWGKQDMTVRRGINLMLLLPGEQRHRT